MTRRAFATALLVIAALALIGRVAYTLTVARSTRHSYDEVAYRSAAASIADGHPFNFYP